MANNRVELDSKFTDYIISSISHDINEHGEASLLVSGGSTPINLFDQLSQVDIPWEKVNITLVDDRFVPDDHPDQNGAMVKTNLLKNYAAKAMFHPLIVNSNDADENLQKVRENINSIRRPFSVVILGMGEDGHTASLFPDCEELDVGMDLENDKDLMITSPTQAPHQRITFTRKALLNTSKLALHCYGNKKNQVLKLASGLKDYRPYPIEAFIHQDKVELNVFWTE
jgi:6-phosphogluconolactonase